jgi:hypothetical protein
MTSKKTPVRLEKDAVVILKAIQRMTPWPISFAALTNLIIRTHGPKFNPSASITAPKNKQ